jgi:hypothetical protein
MSHDTVLGADAPVVDPLFPEPEPVVPTVGETPIADAEIAPVHPVDAARSAAGRMGAERVHNLAKLGREYERENGLTPGRQRRRQLIQLGKRYEVEHGLKAARPRRRPKGDAWEDFLTALARVVKPAHRPAVAKLVAALREGPAA